MTQPTKDFEKKVREEAEFKERNYRRKKEQRRRIAEENESSGVMLEPATFAPHHPRPKVILPKDGEPLAT